MHITYQCMKQQHIIREHQPVWRVYSYFIFYDTLGDFANSIQVCPALEKHVCSSLPREISIIAMFINVRPISRSPHVRPKGNFHYCHVHQWRSSTDRWRNHQSGKHLRQRVFVSRRDANHIIGSSGSRISRKILENISVD